MTRARARKGSFPRSDPDVPHVGENPDTLGNVGHPVAGSARRPRDARVVESDEDMG